MNETTRNIFNRFFGIKNEEQNSGKIEKEAEVCTDSVVSAISSIYAEDVQQSNYAGSCNFDLTNAIPHCPVVLVLDTSHSMWGQGLSDMMTSLHAFCTPLSMQVYSHPQITLDL